MVDKPEVGFKKAGVSDSVRIRRKLVQESGHSSVCTLTSGVPTKVGWMTSETSFAHEELTSPINRDLKKKH